MPYPYIWDGVDWFLRKWHQPSENNGGYTTKRYMGVRQ